MHSATAEGMSSGVWVWRDLQGCLEVHGVPWLESKSTYSWGRLLKARQRDCIRQRRRWVTTDAYRMFQKSLRYSCFKPHGLTNDLLG